MFSGGRINANYGDKYCSTSYYKVVEVISEIAASSTPTEELPANIPSRGAGPEVGPLVVNWISGEAFFIMIEASYWEAFDFSPGIRFCWSSPSTIGHFWAFLVSPPLRKKTTRPDKWHQSHSLCKLATFFFSYIYICTHQKTRKSWALYDNMIFCHESARVWENHFGSLCGFRRYDDRKPPLFPSPAPLRKDIIFSSNFLPMERFFLCTHL